MGPRIIVFSSLFPSADAPGAGVFIKERAFRLGSKFPMVVVSPQAYSPFDFLIRLFKPDFRVLAIREEVIDGIQVFRPRVFSVPGFLKRFDGFLMARGSRDAFRRILRDFNPNVIDAHFAYPDGFAASQLAKEFSLGLCITLRGSKDSFLMGTDREGMMKTALDRASRIVSVSDDLVDRVVVPLCVDKAKVSVVGNGVDLKKFQRIDKTEARRLLRIPLDAKVLIGVGNLIETKGFHRVIDLLPKLKERYPKIIFLVVGGSPGQNKDMLPKLISQVKELDIESSVRFCGRQNQDQLAAYYSASDLFVSGTSFEGWANVFLEAMACGLPVISTDVGGNRQVVCCDGVGTIVSFWDPLEFTEAVLRGLERSWDINSIVSYAQKNSWDSRMVILERIVGEMATERRGHE